MGGKASAQAAVWVFVEGGGHSGSEQTEIRRGFSKLFSKVLGTHSKPTVIACGPRDQALREWRCALESHPRVRCILLVDSEAHVQEGIAPWAHVRRGDGDGWEKPDSATEDQLHFMVHCMESWFLADPGALDAFYGQGFQRSALPAREDVEGISKRHLHNALQRATRGAKTKGSYDKAHGFTLIGLIDPAKIRAASPWAARFFDHLLAVCPAR